MIVLATDGDVEEREIGEVLDALGYHGLAVVDMTRAGATNHEHPCPSWECIRQLRAEGHLIGDEDCCVCWVIGKD
jgi:hypothetical protein